MPRISAKTGLNVDQVLEQIVQKIPAPAGDPKAPLQALIFDALYDSYKGGVIVFCRIKGARMSVGDPILDWRPGRSPKLPRSVTLVQGSSFRVTNCLPAWSAICASIKNVRDTRVGDTVTNAAHPCEEPLPGYKKVNPMVYCGMYPADSTKYPDLRDAWKSCRSTMRRCSMNRRRRWRWASDSAAVS